MDKENATEYALSLLHQKQYEHYQEFIVTYHEVHGVDLEKEIFNDDASYWPTPREVYPTDYKQLPTVA